MNLKRLVVSVFVLSLVMVISPMLHPHAEASMQDYKKTTNIAHRGASGHAPENTIAAFDKAVDMNADYFEVDVQMTKDGQLVLIHDTTVDRTTDRTGSVSDFTLEEIRQLDAGSWFGEAFAGEKIPTLEETLDRYRGKIGVLIELKNPELYPGIEEKVAKALIERNMHRPNNGKMIVQSFNHDSMKMFHHILPEFPLGVLVNSGPITAEQLDNFSAYAEYVNPNKALMDRETVDRIHEYDMKTWPYTVRDQASADYLVGIGVDGISNDFPELFTSPE
ncbi:glycerophosphodiester phosphodiesterase [Shouchella shacheensis]|uniref:glycerophosphodiester phosphodiesterase n=1 Tax=Shouchella shacheensis TaxID=1649580 RepID=UPI00073FF47E|nr:glycerophosphodiester phosphodiesterase family protein [Shouchella shacheensis]